METIKTHDITDATEEEIDELLGYEREEESGESTVEYTRRNAQDMKERGASWEDFERRHLRGREWAGNEEYEAAMDVYGREPEPLPSHLRGILDEKTNIESMSAADGATMRGYENAFFNERARMQGQPTI